MGKSKFKVGQVIETLDGIEGHVVIIFNSMSEDREYFCSMYPGAQAGYYWINVADISSVMLDNKGNLVTLQALNKYKENELKTTRNGE